MKKEILLVSAPMKEEQKEELSALAKEYELVSGKDFNGPVDDVAIMYGWNKEVAEKILDSDQSKLKWVQAESAGVDHIDTDKLKERGILLSNASGVHGNQMSESILGMIFAHTRKIKEAVLNQQTATWDRPTHSTDLNGKNVLIVGTGHIGERLAEILTVFQTNITGVNRSGRQVPHFDKIVKQPNTAEVIGEMDIIISLLPDTKETADFFNADLFEKMKDGVVFINAGRGGSVNTEDLITYCENGKIGFAGLDVFEVEPLPADSPLWKLDNVLITPHSSGVTDAYFDRLYPIFENNLTSFIKTGDLAQNKMSL